METRASERGHRLATHDLLVSLSAEDRGRLDVIREAFGATLAGATRVAITYAAHELGFEPYDHLEMRYDYQRRDQILKRKIRKAVPTPPRSTASRLHLRFSQRDRDRLEMIREFYGQPLAGAVRLALRLTCDKLEEATAEPIRAA